MRKEPIGKPSMSIIMLSVSSILSLSVACLLGKHVCGDLTIQNYPDLAAEYEERVMGKFLIRDTCIGVVRVGEFSSSFSGAIDD